MCGITGIQAFNQVGAFYMINTGASIDSLTKRGPDQRGSYIDDRIALGHRRLSILDLSMQGRQPMEDETGNFVIVFNGEIFNFKDLRKSLTDQGVQFKSETDTEVLLNLFIRKKEKCLHDLVGFYSFAIYNKKEDSLFIARDRFGIKPLYYYHDEDKFIFSSEMKALLCYNIPREPDFTSLYQYLHYNYIPSPYTGIKNVFKLEPGYYLNIKEKQVEKKRYYLLEDYTSRRYSNYEEACLQLENLMEDSVKMRMISDVPLGTFQSGGIDSSVITALASRYKDKLHTFTIGFKDERFFDESKDAELVAKKFNTEHTTFNLSNKELFEYFNEALEYIDDPFADSSALAVYILSKKTREKVTVALSGDGADEIFGGYNKHRAEMFVRENRSYLSLIKTLHPLWKLLPKTRSGGFSNLVRQMDKLAEGGKLNNQERYFRWAGFSTDYEVNKLLSNKTKKEISSLDLEDRKRYQLQFLDKNNSFNDVLRNDLSLVLSNDMLVKVDLMSMANSLEVRVPFLDHRVVEFAFSLPPEWKTGTDYSKKILKDTFSNLLPPELLRRKKRGFEVPLLKWLKTELSSLINDSLLESDFIKDQNIFNIREVEALKKKLNSSNPGDSHAKVWALIVYQYWYKKYILRECQRI